MCPSPVLPCQWSLPTCQSKYGWIVAPTCSSGDHMWWCWLSFPSQHTFPAPSWLGRQAHNLKVTGTEPHANWWLASLAARLWSRPSGQGLQAPLATWWSSPYTHYCVALVWEKELEDINSDQSYSLPTWIGVKSGLTDHPESLLAHARQPLVQHAISFLILAHQ